MYLIGIDLGGTEIKGGLFKEDGEVLAKQRIKTPVSEGFEGVCQAIYRLVQLLVNAGGIEEKNIKAVGVGIPGVCDGEGMVYSAVNLYWTNVPFGKRLRAITGLEIFVENDATMGAIGESAVGSMKGVKNSVLITLGTGVGGGIIIDHLPYSGSHGLGSELGHMIVGENYYDCNCGSNGCLETFASATALVNYTKKLLQEGQHESILCTKCQEDLDKLEAKDVFDAAKEGDQLAQKAVQRLVKYLAIGVANINNILDPDVIALGGGLSKAGDYLLNLLNNEVEKYIFFKSEKMKCRLAIAELMNDAGIIGAAMLAEKRIQISS
ncbi:ROK family protein [Alkaliphilus hydrothermalis]|uniref:Glucokinase n=1 Tax=Alkaliphilus hydrothermalis TaxID=1482730 RepID=A0ABS2NMS2_9FIRM|nr:ROK family glucokinase [Alkaliphilus hydrothermalis]MBM7614230.1 glucokinase [Alkaliphilus hydrothermalis]